MSALTSLVARPRRRPVDDFGRIAAAASALGVLLAIALSLPGSWLDHVRGDQGASGPTYAEMTPAEPLRLSLGSSGAALVAPLAKSDVGPGEVLAGPPGDVATVSWWSGSARAGAPHGQTIVTAHADEAGGGLAPIAGLAEGDTVDLLTGRGTMRYAVSSVRTFDAATMDRVGPALYKQDGGGGRLVMISAGGWDGSAYQHSVVVTGTPLGRTEA